MSAPVNAYHVTPEEEREYFARVASHSEWVEWLETLTEREQQNAGAEPGPFMAGRSDGGTRQ